MSRTGAGIYQLPPGITAEPNTTIRSAQFNALATDLAADNNIPRPITAGGTGGTSKLTAQANIGVQPQSTTTDVTTPSNTAQSALLMMLGSFGWGGEVAVAVPGNDCNLIARTGVYSGVASTTANMPTSDASYTILHMARAATTDVQIAVLSSGAVHVRSKNFSAWGAWRQIDSIVDSGSNANGSYVRYASGKIECRHNVTFNAAINTTYYGGYRSAAQTWTFPISFDDGLGNPTVLIETALGTAFGSFRTNQTTATQAFYAVTAVSSQSAADRTVSLYAVRF